MGPLPKSCDRITNGEIVVWVTRTAGARNVTTAAETKALARRTFRGGRCDASQIKTFRWAGMEGGG